MKENSIPKSTKDTTKYGVTPFEYFEKIAHNVSGLSACIFAALRVCMFVAG